VNKYLILSGVAGLFLGACASVQDADRSGEIASLSSVSIPSEWAISDGTTTQVDHGIGWLERFDDETLNDLVLQAFKHNPNLKRLQARLDQAEAQSVKARSALLPFLSAGANGKGRELRKFGQFID